MVYQTAPFSVTLNDPYEWSDFETGGRVAIPDFKVTPFFDAEYLRNGMRYRQFQWNTNKNLQTPYVCFVSF